MSSPQPWRVAANHSQGRRAVGGSLTVVDGRLIFTPNAFDRLFGGVAVDVALDEVSFGRSPAIYSLGHLFSGGLRARLAVTRADGSEELFVVNGLDRVIGSYKVCITAAGAVSSVSQIKSTGFTDYDWKIQTMIRNRWRYRAVLVNGQPSPVCTAVRFVYSQR